MKTSLFRRSVCRTIHTWAIPVVLACALGSGCATRQQVQSIVAESNAALLAAQLPDWELGADPKSANPPPNPAAISKKIDDFVAAHPDQKVANSSLRVRQAILLLTSEKYELARSAFADATELKTDRDKALKDSSETIIWWWQHGRVDYWPAGLKDEARKNLEQLDVEIAKVDVSVEIRDYLAEMRARMAFQLSKNLQISETATGGLGKKDTFVEAVNRYGANLTPSDVAAIKEKKLSPESLAISPAEKRRLRAEGVIKKAKEALKDIQASNVVVAREDFRPEIQPFGELVLAP